MGLRRRTTITREVFQVGGGELTSPEDAAIYLILVEGHGALIDAGCGRLTDRLFENILACGLRPQDIEFLLITHCHFDHTGGACKVREHTGCRVVAHELDAQYLEAGNDMVTAAHWYGSSLSPVPIDRKLSLPREIIKLGERSIEAVHTPGHSPGSVVYMVESQGVKILFAQDVHGPLDARLLSNQEDYLRSLNLLLSLDADVLCEGHYGVYEGKERVQDFIRSFM